MIARAVPAGLRGFEQLLDLNVVEKVLAALVRVGSMPIPIGPATPKKSPTKQRCRQGAPEVAADALAR